MSHVSSWAYMFYFQVPSFTKGKASTLEFELETVPHSIQMGNWFVQTHQDKVTAEVWYPGLLNWPTASRFPELTLKISLSKTHLKLNIGFIVMPEITSPIFLFFPLTKTIEGEGRVKILLRAFYVTFPQHERQILTWSNTRSILKQYEHYILQLKYIWNSYKNLSHFAFLKKVLIANFGGFFRWGNADAI